MRRRRFSLSSSTTTKKSAQSNDNNDNNNDNNNSNNNRGPKNNTHNFDNNDIMTTTKSSSTKMASPKTKSKSKRKTEAADKVLAATAGVDNWKTWAGRSHGDENFELLDIFRGVKRTIQHNLFTNKPPPGTQCPVCFCEPNNYDDDWYVTSSCFHAVCLDCLRAYTKNQVYDPNQIGPLRCPVCPQVLRPNDAIIALGSNKQLIQQWDLKIRNQLLRAIPAFRHCPHCSSSSSSSTKTSTEGEEEKEKEEAAVTSSDDTINAADTTATTDNTGFGGGGGFVTPECLGPKYEERRETSIKVLYMLPLSSIGLMLLWIVMSSIISKTPSNSPIIDLVFMFLPIPTFIKVGKLANTWIAQEARKQFLKPLKVECPCCDQEFILPAESESYLNDSETSRWIESNTRPCPSCSSPIHKDGGCNHMQCSHCKANFCWACMRLRTNCGAFACRNGAPYRNAVPMPIENNRQRRLPTINVNTDNPLEVIDYILDRQQQRPAKLNFMTDGLLLIYATFIRHFGPFQKGVEVVTAVISSLLTSGIVTSMVALYVAKLTYDRIRIQNIQRHQRHAHRNGYDHHHHHHHHQRRQQRRQRNHHDRGFNNNNLTASELLLGIEERNERQRHHNMNNMMTEEEMIAEATRRSLVEQ